MTTSDRQSEKEKMLHAQTMDEGRSSCLMFVVYGEDTLVTGKISKAYLTTDDNERPEVSK